MLFWQWYDRDYYLTTIIRNPKKAGLSSVFNGFAIIQKSRGISSKTVQSLKMQHFIRIRLKTPTFLPHSAERSPKPLIRLDFSGVRAFFRLFLGYCLTTIFLLPQLNMRPWRSWIARVTPTHKVAGSNPVGRTKMPWNRTVSPNRYTMCHGGNSRYDQKAGCKHKLVCLHPASVILMDDCRRYASCRSFQVQSNKAARRILDFSFQIFDFLDNFFLPFIEQ